MYVQILYTSVLLHIWHGDWIKGESKGLFREIITEYYISKKGRTELRVQKCDLFVVRVGSTRSKFRELDHERYENSYFHTFWIIYFQLQQLAAAKFKKQVRVKLPIHQEESNRGVNNLVVWLHRSRETVPKFFQIATS